MSHWCPVLWNLSTVKCHLYIQCTFVYRRESAWWNFTTFKWPHGQRSGKTGRYVHHHYWGANGGEELLYWPCPACHLRTILCCTLTYYWTSQLVTDRINQKKERSDTPIFCKWSRSSANFSFLFAKIQIGRPFVKRAACFAKILLSGLVQKGQCSMTIYFFANILYCLVRCKKDGLVWQFTFLQIFYIVWFGAKRMV